MFRNQCLTRAKLCPKDEFYTCYEDVKRECDHYQDAFRDKVIYCNCDDPRYSQFWRYFHENFEVFGLKRLLSTFYDVRGSTYLTVYEGGKDSDVHAGICRKLSDDGDFRSPECLTVLLSCDIVVTNPPFSLFQEYMQLLLSHQKQFLIMGPVSAVSGKTFFPYVKQGLVLPGFLFNQTLSFVTPDAYPLVGQAFVDDFGRHVSKVSGICFFTNLHASVSKDLIPLTCSYAQCSQRYPRYDNYDAIECSYISDLPYDYDGVIGVPVTFLGRYCSDQFEILGETSGRREFDSVSWPTKRYVHPLQHDPKTGLTTNGGKMNTGAQLSVTDDYEGVYYTADNAEGRLRRVYRRILIRRRV